jgi:hypothetical protein
VKDEVIVNLEWIANVGKRLEQFSSLGDQRFGRLRAETREQTVVIFVMATNFRSQFSSLRRRIKPVLMCQEPEQKDLLYNGKFCALNMFGHFSILLILT